MKKYISPRTKDIELLHEAIIASSGSETVDIQQQEAGAEVLSHRENMWKYMEN